MSFKKEMETRRQEVEIIIDKFLGKLEGIPQPLLDSMKYSLSAGGKRIRPVMFLECYRVFGGEINQVAIDMAVAIECIHTYSLIHDDLPCMDNDDFRRGKPTNHKVYGEGIAVLAGDALLNMTYELLIKCAHDNLSDYERIIRASKVIADSVGSRGLIAGQTIDIQSDKMDKISPAEINFIYQHKTGDLFTAAAVSGAILGGANDEEIAAVKEYADNYGYAFQIYDDLLELEESSEDSDKKTFVKIYGVSCAKKTVKNSLSKALEMISKVNINSKFLKSLAVHTIDI